MMAVSHNRTVMAKDRFHNVVKIALKKEGWHDVENGRFSPSTADQAQLHQILNLS